MALRYGTDNHESEAFVRRRVAVADRHTSSAASRKTFAVAAVGVSMLAGSALLGYHASRDGSATMLRAETNTMNLDASFDPSAYDVPQFLRNQPEIVVFSGDDQSLCMDDGGARKNALSAVTVRDCRPTSVDQVFVYDDKQLMLKSAKKPDLCLSDGGATQPGDGPVHMAPCDPSSADQRFVYVDVQFRNPIKDLCLSSGGGVGTPFKMEACDPQAVDETLRILWQNEVGGPIDEYKDDEVSQSSQPMEGTTTYSEPVSPMEEAPMHMPGEGGAGVPPMEDTTFEEPVSPMEEAPIRMPGEGGAGVPPIEEAPMHMPGEGGAGVPPMEDTTFEEPVSSMEKGPMGRGDDAVVSPIEDAPTMSEDSEGTSTFGDPVRVAPHHITGENGAGLPPTTFSDSEPATPGHDEMTSPTLENPVDGGHVEETTYGDTIPVPVHMTGVNGAGRPPVGLLPVGDGESEPPHAAVASLTALAGDWNLLAPSHATIGSVNVDASADVTADEIYKYLLGVKIAAEQQYETTVSKYIRTTKCVTAGLESLAKSSLTESEYHALVDWMYEHCATTPPSTHGGGVANATDVAVDRVYMTKLEFYYKLKEHFTGPREELFGHAEGIKLRGEVGVATREKLAACIEEASARFGRDALLHSAIQWVQTECAKI